MSTVAELRRVTVRYGSGAQAVTVLDGIDLAVAEGEILGVVGESGAGKSALARSLLRLVKPAAGQVLLEGADITGWSQLRLRRLRARMTMVFHDPAAVLNPRMTVRALLEEPLRLHTRLAAGARRAAAEDLAARVRLQPGELDRRPPALDPARLQLVSLARAIATRPRLLVLDEPTSLLHATAAADLLDLLDGLRSAGGIGIVLICNDIATMRKLADRVAVLYLGEVVEQGPTAEVTADPLHPYTQALMSAHLSAEPARRGRRIRLRGDTPSPEERTPGCAFAPRCPIAEGRCRSGSPTPNVVGNRSVACVRVLEGNEPDSAGAIGAP